MRGVHPRQHRSGSGGSVMTVRTAFDESVAASSLIRPVDAALVAAGQKIADHLDDIDSLTPAEQTKALYLMPHMVNLLREMLATPLARKNAGISDGPDVAGKLHALRSAHGKSA